MHEITQILEFTKFTHKFQKVIRTIYANGEDRCENDAEHSFQLALLAWYLISANKLDYDLEKIIKYCISHDLVETYAGDTYFHTQDQEAKDSKVMREADAAQQIRAEFPEFVELHQAIEDYEARNDQESRFVYALDKVIPVINIYLDGGRSWKDHKVSLEMIRTKDAKVALSEDVQRIWVQLVDLLEKEQTALFN